MTDQSWLSVLWPGLIVTVELLGVCVVIDIVVALLLALARTCTVRWLRAVATVYVDVMRSVPVLGLLVLAYFGAGSFWVHIGVSAFWVAALVISLNEAAYLSEVYRSAILSVGPRQWDAGASLGLSRGATLRRIVLPQAILPAIPPTINDVLYLLKATSLASLVAVGEMTAAAFGLVSQTFEPMQVYLLLSGLYLALAVPISYAGKAIEYGIGRRYGLRAVAAPKPTLLRRQLAVAGGAK